MEASFVEEEKMVRVNSPTTFWVRYIVSSVLICAILFFFVDYWQGSWGRPEKAVVIKCGENRFGTLSDRMVRVETNPHLGWYDRDTLWIRTEREQYEKVPTHGLIIVKSYRGAFTGLRYENIIISPN